MGIIGRRLGRLEEKLGTPEDERKAWAHREFLKRLTSEELSWLLEPGYEAASRVPCPRFEPVRCDCLCIPRAERGYEAHPELEEERARRWKHLYDRREEIFAREPDTRETQVEREKRKAESLARQKASAERNRRHGIGA